MGRTALKRTIVEVQGEGRTMKQSARVIRALVAVGLFVVMLFGFAVSTAMASFDVVPAGTPIATSATNPNDNTDAESWWRLGWGNDLHPEFTLTAPPMDPKASPPDGVLIGTAYTVDQNLMSTITTGIVGGTVVPVSTSPIYRTGRVTGTYFDNTLDMPGVYANSIGQTWASSMMPSLEGQGIYHWSWVSSTKGYGPTQYAAGVGLDFTKPDKVTGVTVLPGPSLPATTAWLPTTRAVISWDRKKYDKWALGYYQVVVTGTNGVTPIPEIDDTPGHGRVYAMDQTFYPSDPFTLPTSVTIEHMPPGESTIQIGAVDRATNEGPLSDKVVFRSDPDTPTIAFTSPLGGFLTEHTIVAADAADEAGSPQVVLTLKDPNGVVVGTRSFPFGSTSYQWTPGVTPTTTGVYSLTATATDHYGRTVITSRTLDGTVASGFFPTDSDGLGTAASASSNSNPDLPDSSDLWWRQGWGNSLTPDFTLSPPSTDTTVGPIIGMFYTVDRTATTTLDPTQPGGYDRAARGTGTNLNSTLDMVGINAYGSGSPGGSVEGRWFLHSVFYTSEGYASPRTDTEGFGIDMTPPGAVTSLTVSPAQGRSDPGTWTASGREVVSWNPAFDALSGVAYYQVYIDGQPVVPDPTQQSGDQGRVYELAGKMPSTITLESVPAGAHTISVAAVDRATNVGPSVTATYYSDPDTPTVTFTSPVGASLTATSPIAVDAEDAAGDPTVSIKILGSSIPTATFTAAPYSYSPDLSNLPAGTYTVRAVATDHMGRTAAATKVVSWDAVAVTIDSVLPNPAVSGQNVNFSAHATDSSGHAIMAWQWSSNLDGILSTTQNFTSNRLSVGTHIISVQAECTKGTWSPVQQIQVVVTGVGDSVTAVIDGISPSPAAVGDSVAFSGHATDSLGHAITAYQWRSSIGGLLSTSASFSTAGLTAGSHTIYFKAQCANGTWSPEVSRTLVVSNAATMLPVYRFYNFKAGVHFYTADPAEKQHVVDTMSDTYRYEGVAYSINTANAANNLPLYRFYNQRTGVHFYTASENEKTGILNDPVMSTYMTLDGVAYYVSAYSPTATTVYRFYNVKKGVHFYTASEAEKAATIKNLSATYQYEGPGFYFEAN